MELLLLFTLMTGQVDAASTSDKIAEKSSAEQIIEINEKSFSQKKLINDPSLCKFHSELLKEVGRKPLPCNRDNTPETKDAEVAKQLQEANQLTQYTAPSVDDMIVNLPRRK